MRKYEDVQADLAQTIKLRRVALGWTQEDLAAQSEVERARVGEIERRTANPTLRTLTQLAGALQLELSELLKASAARK